MYQVANEQLLDPSICWFQLIASRPKLHVNICITNTLQLKAPKKKKRELYEGGGQKRKTE